MKNLMAQNLGKRQSSLCWTLALLLGSLCVLCLLPAAVFAAYSATIFVDTSLPIDSYSGNNCQSNIKPCASFANAKAQSDAFFNSVSAGSGNAAQSNVRLTWSCALRTLSSMTPYLSQFNASACVQSMSTVGSVINVANGATSGLLSDAEQKVLLQIGASHAFRLPYRCDLDKLIEFTEIDSTSVTLDVDPLLYSVAAFAGATRIVAILDGTRCGYDWKTYQQYDNNADFMLDTTHGSVSNIVFTNIRPNIEAMGTWANPNILGYQPSEYRSPSTPLLNQLTLNSVGFINVVGAISRYYVTSSNSAGTVLLQDVAVYNYSLTAIDLRTHNSVQLNNVLIEQPDDTRFPIWARQDCPQGSNCGYYQCASFYGITTFVASKLSIINCKSIRGVQLADIVDGSISYANVIGGGVSADDTYGTISVETQALASSKFTIANSTLCGITKKHALGMKGSVKMRVVGSVFCDNYSPDFDVFGITVQGGAAIYAEGSAKLSVISCTFTNCSANNYGGAILFKASGEGILSDESRQALYILDSVFQNTRAGKDGGAIYAMCGVSLKNVTISNSQATNGGCMALYQARNDDENFFELVHFDGCQATSNGGGLYMREAKSVQIKRQQVTITNSKALQGSGGAMYLARSEVLASQLIIDNAYAGVSGGGIALEEFSVIMLYQSSISNTMAVRSGGAISFSGEGYIAMNQVAISYVQSYGPGGFLSLSFAGVNDQPIIWTMPSNDQVIDYTINSFTGIRVLLLTQVNVISSYGLTGDFVFCNQFHCPNLAQLISSGNITVQYEPFQGSQPLITPRTQSTDARGLKLLSFTAKRLRYSAEAVQVDGSPFNETIALKPSGSEATYKLYPSQSFQLDLMVMDYFGKHITLDTDFMASISLEAPFGSKVVLVPTMTSKIFTTGILSFLSLKLQGPSGPTVTIVVSFTVPSTGEKIGIRLPVQMIQCPLGFVEAGEPAYSCIECVNAYSRIRGATNCTACPAHSSCSGPYITSEEGYQTLYQEPMLVTDTQFTEAQTYVNTDNVPMGFFSIQGDGLSSSSMLDVTPANKSGKSSFLPLFDVVAPCPNPTSCKKANACAGNRAGYLCGSCAEGYSEWNGSCVPCTRADGGTIVLYLFYLAVIFLVTHVSAQSQSSASTKILSWFTQSYLLTVGPYVQLLAWAQAIFAFNITIGNGGSSSALNCPFPRDSYGRMLTNLIQPVAFLLVLIVLCIVTLLVKSIIFVIVRVARRSREEATQQAAEDSMLSMSQQVSDNKIDALANNSAKKLVKFVAKRFYSLVFDIDCWARSLVQLLILSYTMFSNAGLSYFSCKSYGGNSSVVLSATDIMCEGAEYYARGTPFIIALVYSFGLPVLILALLVVLKLTKKLDHPVAKRWLGNLFLNYRPQYAAFAEAWAMLRRLAVASAVAFVSDNTTLQVVLLPMFAFFLLVHLCLLPYVNKAENLAESVGLLSLIVMVAIRGQTGFEASQAAPGVLLAIFIFSVVVIIASYVLNHWLVRLIAIKVFHPIIAKINSMRLRDDAEEVEKQETGPVASSPGAPPAQSTSSPSVEMREMMVS